MVATTPEKPVPPLPDQGAGSPDLCLDADNQWMKPHPTNTNCGLGHWLKMMVKLMKTVSAVLMDN